MVLFAWFAVNKLAVFFALLAAAVFITAIYLDNHSIHSNFGGSILCHITQ